MNPVVVIALCVAALVIGAAIAGYICFNKGIAYRRKTAEAAIGSAEKEAERLSAEAEKAVEALKAAGEDAYIIGETVSGAQKGVELC